MLSDKWNSKGYDYIREEVFPSYVTKEKQQIWLERVIEKIKAFTNKTELDLVIHDTPTGYKIYFKDINEWQLFYDLNPPYMFWESCLWYEQPLEHEGEGFTQVTAHFPDLADVKYFEAEKSNVVFKEPHTMEQVKERTRHLIQTIRPAYEN